MNMVDLSLEKKTRDVKNQSRVKQCELHERRGGVREKERKTET